ncbi:MAG: fasciclin domain-containing protein [Sphingomonadales bacterium]|nr:fasciclin domain-containing protein [Sphingomonadales bacterium]
MTIARAALLAAGLALSLGGCKRVPNDGADNAATADQADDETIASLASADSNLSGAEELLRAADLDTTLAGPGPYSVFLPSNAALETLPAEVVAALKDEQAKPQLTALLTGHIVPGSVTVSDIAKAIDAGGGKAELKTMAGDMLSFAKQGDSVTVTAPGGATAMLSGDGARAANGVVHVIDGVLVRS